jgi:hypothetical protein
LGTFWPTVSFSFFISIELDIQVTAENIIVGNRYLFYYI